MPIIVSGWIGYILDGEVGNESNEYKAEVRVEESRSNVDKIII